MNSSNYKTLMNELRTEYLQSFDEKFNLLNELYLKKDWYSIESEYHKLKGTGATYGAPEVSTICEKLESICKKNNEIDLETIKLSILILKKIKAKYLENLELNLETDHDFQKLKSL